MVRSDDPISAMLDSLMNVKYFQFEQKTVDEISNNKHNYDSETVPVFDDNMYTSRMAKLDAQSPFKLDYNPIVRSYIDMYTIRKRGLVSKMLGLSQMYFPIFEEALDKYNLPLELKYLAIVESALNPNAVSPVGATGLWQFMYGTGKMFGLEVNSYVDYRRDPIKATEGACKYFLFLYDMFHDWQLVLAAYNSGPGNVNKAIRRSGGKTNFWEIARFLPRETQGYVPAFIAVTYVMNHTVDHNLYPMKPKMTYYKTDTVKTRQQVTFSQISQIIGIPMEDLEYLNPMYKHKVIPHNEEGSVLVLPIDQIGAYITNEATIYAYKSPQEKLKEEIEFMARQTTYKEVLKSHKVRKGENLVTISRKYHCTVAEIKQWNHIKGKSVPAGKRLNIYVQVPVYEQKTAVAKTDDKNQTTGIDAAKAEATDSAQAVVNVKDSAQAQSKAKNTAKNNYPKVVYYTVQPGDTLWRIAQKYDGVSVDDLKAWNRIKGGKSLKAGAKLKVNVGT